MILKMRLCILIVFIFCNVELAFADFDKVVVIYATVNGKSSKGTGFFITKTGDIATAYHVIENADSIEVWDNNRDNYKKITLKNYDENLDLAIIKVESKNEFQYFNLSTSLPKVRDEFRVLGHPRGMLNQDVKAVASQTGTLNSLTFGRDLFAKSQQIIPLLFITEEGMSGAPVVNKSGHVIGVFSGSINTGGSFAWAIPTSNLKELLNRPSKNETISSKTQWNPLTLMVDESRHSLRQYIKNDAAIDVPQKFARTLSRLTRTNNELSSRSFVSSVPKYCDEISMIFNFSKYSLSKDEISPQQSLINLNNHLKSSIYIRFNKPFLLKTIKLIQNRIRDESFLRDTASRFMSWMKSTDIDNDEKDEFNEYVEAINSNYPEISFDTFESIYEIKTKQFLQHANNIANIGFYPNFKSIEKAEEFLAGCYIVSAGFGRYSTFMNTNITLDTEIYLFNDYFEMISYFEEYFAYIPR